MTDAGRIDAMLARAVACLNAGDWAGAGAQTAQVLRAAPGHPVALYLSGVALLEQGRWDDAARALAAAWRAAPEQADIALALAQAQEAGGAPDAALATLAETLARWPAMAPAAIQLGTLAVRSGRAAEAIAPLRAALSATRDPAERSALDHQLGLALKATRQHADALVHLDRALNAAPDLAAVQRARAGVLQHLGRYAEAAEALRAVLAIEPLDLATHIQLNELIHRQDLGAASFLRSYDEAARAAPDSPLLPLAKGHALLTVGRASEAHDAFAAALRIAPDHPSALAGIGRALEALGELGRAAAAHDRSTAGDDVGALVDGAAFRLRQGDAAGAAALAERAVAREHESQGALAMLGLCHRALGREAEYRLNDYERLVRVFDLEPPRGFSDMASFNAELAAYLDALHGDRRENFTQTLRGGTRIYDSIFANGHDLADRLRERIDEALARYVGYLPDDAAHPFTRRRSNRLAYASSWSSRMSAAGYHLNHIHPEGWLSSAYYVAVPDVVADEVGQEGWLTLGQPTPDFGALAPRRTIRPAVGRLVLFPSYIWHGTTPFQSDEQRMTIAFDALPAR